MRRIVVRGLSLFCLMMTITLESSSSVHLRHPKGRLSRSGQRFNFPQISRSNHLPPLRDRAAVLSDWFLEKVERSVFFYLWTRSDPAEPARLRYSQIVSGALATSSFDRNLSTVILVHGFDDNGLTNWVVRMKDALLDKGEFNVFSVDWRILAWGFYPLAVANVKPVGELTGDLVNFLINEYHPVSHQNVHPIGFSLGAHVVGHLGFHLDGRLSRISGLDPAGPFFYNAPASERLSTDDAQFVDVIHSSGFWIGIDYSVGHVDFYPNGGFHPQPGCQGEGLSLECSHFRATALFEESISSEIGFESLRCESWTTYEAGNCTGSEVNRMGWPAERRTPGTFYLLTNAQPPYAIPPV